MTVISLVSLPDMAFAGAESFSSCQDVLDAGGP